MVRTRVWMAAAALAAIIAAVPTCVHAQEAEKKSEAPAPALEKRVGPFLADRVSIDLGRFRDNEKRTATFTLKNAAAADLKISEVKKSCGCTTAEVAKTLLKPGEITTLKVVYDGAHRQGKDQKVVTVVTDDKSTPTADFTFTAEVIARIAVEPRAVFLGEVPVMERSAAKEIRVISRRTDLELKIQAPTDPNFVVEQVGVKSAKADGDDVKEFTYSVYYNGSGVIDEYKSQLVLASNDAELPNIAVFMLANVVGVMRVLPGHQIQIAEQKPNAPIKQQIFLSHRQQLPWKLVDYRIVDAPPELQLTLELDPEDPNRPGWRTLTLKGRTPEKTPPGGYKVTGKIRLAFDQSDEPEAVIRLEGFLAY